jgi:hypothetical protein
MNYKLPFLPWIVVGCAAVCLLMVMTPWTEDEHAMHLYDFGTIPVQDGGRIKPLDTVARNDMMLMSHRQTYVDEHGNSEPAIKWMLATMLSMHRQRETPSPVNGYSLFRIENDEVRNVMRLEARPGLRYSWNEMGKPTWYKLTKADIEALQETGKVPDALIHRLNSMKGTDEREFADRSEFMALLTQGSDKESLERCQDIILEQVERNGLKELDRPANNLTCSRQRSSSCAAS